MTIESSQSVLSIVYYGEELGMKGAGKDENKRAPMYFSPDASSPGMCKGPDGMDGILTIPPCGIVIMK